MGLLYQIGKIAGLYILLTSKEAVLIGGASDVALSDSPL